MASNVVTLTLRVRWWVTPYVNTLAFFCWITGCAPDIYKVANFIVRYGFKIEHRPG